MASLLLALLYYTVVAIGSVSIGYLVIRLSHAETRLLDEEHKLGYSALLGAALALSALAADALFSGTEKTLAANGVFPAAFFAAVVVSLIALKTWFHLHAPRTATIGVPLHSPIEEKLEESQLEASPQQETEARQQKQAEQQPREQAQPTEEEDLSALLAQFQPPEQQAPEEKLEEISVVPQEKSAGAVKELSFEDMYVALSEEEKTAKRRKTLDELLTKARELKQSG